MRNIQVESDIDKIVVSASFKFSGCEAHEFDNMVELFIWDYMPKFHSIKFSRDWRNQRDHKSDARKEWKYHGLDGTMRFLKNAIMTQ